MAKDDFLALEGFQRAARELGYKAEILAMLEDVALDTLTISFVSEDGRRESSEELLTVSVFPAGDDLEGSRFLQFYFQYPFTIDRQKSEPLLREIHQANLLLPLGHFNFDSDRTFIYFKYVLAFPLDLDVQASFLSDVLDMCIYSWHAFRTRFEVFT